MDTNLLRLSIVFAVLTGFTAFSAAAAPSHPLSQIDPVDEDLDMSTGPGGPYNVTGVPGIEPYNGQLTVAGQMSVDGQLTASGGLDVAGNDISNYFGNNCGPNEAISQINADGSYQCANVSAITSDKYVDEAGDTMTGDLALSSGATVTGVPNPSASSDAVNRGWASTTYLNRDGSDVMGGNLDMDGHNVINADFCTSGTCDVNNYQTFTSSGIGASNIYDGSGGEIDFQSNIELNGNTIDDNDGTVNFVSESLDVSTGGTSQGIEFGNTDAITGTPGNGWLRLNQDGNGGGGFDNGVYTPGSMRIDGDGGSDSVGGNVALQLRGHLDMRDNQIQNAQLTGSVRLPTGADQY